MTREEAVELLCYGDWLSVISEHIGKMDTERIAEAMSIARKALQSALTPPNEWVSVEERLPEDEARQYIEDDLDGIGYLYPCLLTYKSPNTERIHVVRFYYDIIQKWFVNNREELCEKGRCIAWMPLPAPYDRRPPEGEGDT